MGPGTLELIMRFTTALALWICLLTSSCVSSSTAAAQADPARSWRPLDSGSQASLRGLSVVDERVVWASGSEGTVLRSLDGGAHWQRLLVPGSAGMDFRDIHAFDERTAFVMGITQPACVKRTLDGGVTWETVLQSPLAEDFFDSLTFFDRQRACLFGDPQDGVFRIFVSSDGGQSWRAVDASLIPAALGGEAAFAASGTCISSLPDGRAWIGTGGGAARVLRSRDFGNSWEAQRTPMVSGGTQGIYSVAFLDLAEGIVVGGDYARPDLAGDNAALTLDGGQTWELVEEGRGLSGYRSAVAYVPGRPGALVAMGRGGSDFSLDGGSSWEPLGGEGYYAMAFGPMGVGYAVGAGGRIAKIQF